MEQFDGAFEKLKRAHENINNLNSEIEVFLKAGPQPVGDDDDHERFFELQDYALQEVPPRFSVLAGEVFHHLRTSLNHTVWCLVPDADRTTKTEFPIFLEKPITKDEISRFNGKVKGLDGGARAFIESLQPYQGSDPMENPLFVVHEMDRIDKHQSLAIARVTIALEIDPMKALDAEFNNTFGGPKSALTNDAKFTPQISFRQIGKRKNQPVVPALSNLYSDIRNLVEGLVTGSNKID